MCLTECLMLHFFRNSLNPAARRSACRLLNRKGQQGWIELAERENQNEENRAAREIENDQRRMPVMRLSHPVVGLSDEGVTWCNCSTPVFTCILLLCSCQIRQEREDLWSRLIFYLDWMRHFGFQWGDRHLLPLPGFNLSGDSFSKNKELFSGVLQQAIISVKVSYQTDRRSFVDVFDFFPLPAIELWLLPCSTKLTAIPPLCLL